MSIISIASAVLLAATSDAITVTSIGTTSGSGGSSPTSAPTVPGGGGSSGGSSTVSSCTSSPTGKFRYNAFGTGMAGVSSYVDYMNITGDELACGTAGYQTFNDLKTSTCFFCTNLWSIPYSEPNTSLLDNGAYPKHSKGYNAVANKPAYKDYSNSMDDGYIVGAYATEWGIYRASRPFGFDSVPFYKGVNYLLYGFLPVCGMGYDGVGQMALCTVNDCTAIGAGATNPYFALNQACIGAPDGSIVIHDPWAAFHTQSAGNTGSFHQLFYAKAEYGDKIKIMPSVGGWSLSKIFFDMHDENIRSNFIQSAVNLLTAWNFFDGIDVDWEFPGGLGADAGKVKYALMTENIDEPSVNGGCSASPDPSGETTPFASFSAIIRCTNPTREISEWIDIPPCGCAASKAKREKIADGYQSWGKHGKTRDEFVNCTECDASIAYKLFTELRTALDNIPGSRPSEMGDTDKYQITTAISGGPDKINEVDYGKLVNEGAIDHIFIMTYDFMGAWGGVGHQTNLYNNAAVPDTISIQQSVQALYDQGCPSESLVVGVASYGRGWKGNFGKSTDLNTIFNTTPTGPCAGDIEDGVVDYATILSKSNSGAMIQVWDDCAMAHMTVGTNEAYTGDSIDSVWAKGEFVKQNKLAGLFTWELAQDDYAAPIVNAMNEALGRVPNSGSVTNPTVNYKTSTCEVKVTPVPYASRKFTGPQCEY